MKSGTNWIGNLLNLHPEISCIGELHLHSLFRTMQSDLRSLPIMVDPRVRHVIRGNLQSMFRQTLVDLADDPRATVIGERTPHTLAPLTIKGAPQITITRDGRDVLISRMFHLYNYPEVSRVFQRFPHLQKTLKAFQKNQWHFREHPEQLLPEEELVRESMRWWREHHESDRRTMARHPSLRVLHLRYEDFHTEIESNRRAMYSFLEVDPDTAAPIPDSLKPSLDKERPNEFNRKGQIGDWQNYVDKRVQKWINAEAGDELIRQGYIQSLDW